MHTQVFAVHRDSEHRFSKTTVPFIELLKGLGVQGDAHADTTVQHRSRVKANPDQPNLRQVHVISASLLAHVAEQGFSVQPGQLGENITLSDAPGLDWRAMISLPLHTELHFASGAVVQLTGLRNPCVQIDQFEKGLFAAMLDKDAQGQLVRKTGVMGVVLRGGAVQAGDAVHAVLPAEPHQALERV
ncbi:MOSC domain-containing protein [Comamonas serinivorans]|uniref:MOSC domain-containing protein n=1 Tax=Comamonas serinivorans TaxID=1082851 RepID=A0A1Y0EPC9_9BURK|nr:MOSC domain-containing protein [Comamonas serinivorans]ARU05300.1 MOSC domain-containing protein [Comamonas serinivorans]